MKRLLLICFYSCLFVFSGNQLRAQCAGVSFTETVNSVGQLVLNPLAYYDGPNDYQSLTLSETDFACGDVGSHIITLTVVDASGVSSSCDFTLEVVDNIAPIPICVNEVNLQLDASGNAVLIPDVIDAGSYDNCGIHSFDLSQTDFNCSHEGLTIPVTFVVLDIHGNFNTCITNVNVSSFPNPNQNLACNQMVYVSLDGNGQAEVVPDMILEGGPYACPDAYQIVLEDDGFIIPNNILTTAQLGDTVIATITDIATGNSCWGTIFVDGNPGCPTPYLITDTECNSSPTGPSHSLSDGVEWPCDLDLDYCSPAFNSFSPDEMLAAGVPEADVRPQILHDSCGLVGMTYQDLVMQQSDGGVIIERTWTIVDWYQYQAGGTGLWSYVQNITAAVDSLYICDTQAWDTPVGDCASGHTLDDDVEWPASFSMSSCDVSLVGLENNPDVHPNNVRPDLGPDCSVFQTVFQDEVIHGDSVIKVIRTWTILNWISGQANEYIQIISITNADCDQSVCAYNMWGEGINQVIVYPGYETDASGCVAINDPTITWVTPVKIDEMDNGVDIFDYTAARRHVLGIETLTPNQQLAADVNGNGNITTLDLVLISKIILGEPIDPTIPAWRFYDPTLNIQIDAPLGHEVLGIKVGDVTGDANVGGAPNPLISKTIGAEDDVINSGESYRLPIHIDRPQYILGFQLQLELDVNYLQLNGISSDLENFDESNYILEDGILSIRWTPSEEDLLRGGVFMEDGAELFELDLLALNNGVFSRDLRNGVLEKNKIVEQGYESSGLTKLVWSNEITIGNRDLHAEQDRLSIFPNPANEFGFVQIKDGGAEKFQLNVFNAIGQIVYHDNFVGDIKFPLQDINTGYYLIQVIDQDGKIFMDKLQVIR